ncbi:hypothetical protein BDD12DRAFT_885287 [Trichophaea hybrida]|nr:hypothetical protein BDD12DRAFT_885287 [Trichophaea hybrida]
MSSRQASLQKYIFYGTIVITLVISAVSYHSYTTRSRPRKSLRRSNATRRRPSPSRRHQRTNAAAAAAAASAADSDGGGVLTDEQLFQHLNQEVEPGANVPLGIHIPESAAEALTETGHAAQQARGARHGVNGREGRTGRRSSEHDTELSFEETKENNENQNLLTLLYTIAQDQAQRESYVHRGVTCNNCQIIPIRGIRYRCANCLDYDLCEVCEALDSVHTKTHLFYKIRIPAPFIGNPRQAQVPCYPGKPQMMVMSLNLDTTRQLKESTKRKTVEQAELEALYEQFKVLAASEYNDTKFGIHGAISRETFDKCFIPNTHLRPPAPNLIYDRMFNFYDTKGDGLVDFEEFAIGVSYTNNNKNKTPEKLRRVFKGYDLNDDGYVERKDFLRMFKAFYLLSKVLVKDIVASLGDELYEQGHMDQALNGRQPISAVFTSSIPPAGRSWEKPESANNDYEDEGSNSPVVLPSSKDHMTLEDLEKAHGRCPTPDNPSENDRGRRIENDRRTRFWTLVPEEGEDLMIPDDEKDVGSEVLFHMAMRGINELLDLLFKEKEKAAVEAEFADTPAEKESEKARDPETKAETKAEENMNGEASDTLETGNKKDENEPDSSSSSKKEKEKENEQENLAAIREEIKQRGGEGRLNYEEFEKIMTGSESNKLDFVGTWTELASF